MVILIFTKISVISINLNNKKGIVKTIQSVIAQDFDDFQYLVIDGGSKDGGVDEINKFNTHIDYFVSEPDKGIYNAMNKGILVAKGDYLLFLNSGDYLCDNNTLSKVAKYLGKEDIVWGELVFSKNDSFLFNKPLSDSAVTRIVKYDYKFKLGRNFWLDNYLPHPATFVNKKLFNKFGLFDETYRIVADYALLMKFVICNKASYKHIPLIVTVFDVNGISSNPKNTHVINKERFRAQISCFPFYWRVYFLFFYSFIYGIMTKLIPPSSKKRKFLKRVALFFVCFFFHHNKYDRAGINRAMKNLERHLPFLKIVRSEKLIISLTSIPERMDELHFVLYSLFNQTIKPDKIILWLGETQFSDYEKNIPKKVLSFCNLGLEIKFCKDIKSFKKLVPSLQLFPNDLIVTADDDIYYPSDWLEKLFTAYQKEPNYIHCHRASSVLFNDDDKIIPYNEWPEADKEASLFNFFTTGGGIICKKDFFIDSVCDDNIFMNICPTADDVWFWACAISKKTLVKVVNDNYAKIIGINCYRDRGLSKQFRLCDINVLAGKNDEQLKEVFNYFNLYSII